MPSEIVIVRHGLCSGNVAERASSKGDHSLFTDSLWQQDSETWPLVPRGIWQSEEAGRLIRSAVSENFDHYLSSDMDRAIQTANHLNFANAIWEIEALLRERSWGGTERIPNPEREKICLDFGLSPTEDSLDWCPPGGESMRMVMARMRIFLERARRDYRDQRLLLVSHGAFIQALRVFQHNVNEENYLAFISNGNYIRNGHVFRFFGKKRDNGTIPLFQFEQSASLNADGSWAITVRTLV